MKILEKSETKSHAEVNLRPTFRHKTLKNLSPAEPLIFTFHLLFMSLKLVRGVFEAQRNLKPRRCDESPACWICVCACVVRLSSLTSQPVISDVPEKPFNRVGCLHPVGFILQKPRFWAIRNHYMVKHSGHGGTDHTRQH